MRILKDAALIEKLMEDEEGRELLTHVLRGKVVGELFWQPSSRTFHSFTSAASRLGAAVGSERGIKAPKSAWQTIKDFFRSFFTKVVEKWILLFSSEAKDAHFEDEIRAFALSYDLLILRTGIAGLVGRAADIIGKSLSKIKGFNKFVPVINAGDGDREHPTQTLIDVKAIFCGFNLDPEKDWEKLSNLSIAFVNDGKHSRTVHSLAWILGTVFKMRLDFISRKGFEMSRKFLGELRARGVECYEHYALRLVDIIYDQRPQVEYHGVFGRLRSSIKKIIRRLINLEPQYIAVTKQIADKYGVRLVLHPFPRSKKWNELPIWLPASPKTEKISLDTDERAGYFIQMAVAVPIRMALLTYFLKQDFDFRRLAEMRLERSFTTQCGSCGALESSIAGWGDKKCKRVVYLPLIPFCPMCLEEK